MFGVLVDVALISKWPDCVYIKHEATPTNYALVHKAYTVEMHIPM